MLTRRFITISRYYLARSKLYGKEAPRRFQLESPLTALPKSQRDKASLEARENKLKSVRFHHLKLRDEVMKALEMMKIKKPTPIQALAIPQILSGQDVLCSAETGSGKTLAYLAPIMDRLRFEESEQGILRLDKRPRAVIAVPSKELAAQVLKTAKDLSHTVKMRVEGAIEKVDFEGAFDIVVGTPEKLLQYQHEGRFSFSEARYLAIDEADTLFEKDFGEQCRKLIAAIKKNPEKKCQFMLISATIPKSLNKMIQSEFPDIVKLASPKLHCTVPSLKQKFVPMEGHGDNKQRALLKTLIENPPKDTPTIIFCNTIGGVRALSAFLSGLDDIVKASDGASKISSLHGKILPFDRKETVANFQNGSINLLIATDVASRGLDTTRVRHVILYDFPQTTIDYLHRVGRTARAGRSGMATSLVAKKDKALAKRIEYAVKYKCPLA